MSWKGSRGESTVLPSNKLTISAFFHPLRITIDGRFEDATAAILKNIYDSEEEDDEDDEAAIEVNANEEEDDEYDEAIEVNANEEEDDSIEINVVA